MKQIPIVMRALLLVSIICLAGMGHLQAQTSITLTFTAFLSGVHHPLDSIHLKNLSQAGDTMLHGNDTVLTLYHGIGIPDPVNGATEGLVVYPAAPNPFSGSTTIRLYLAQRDRVSIRAVDLLGREQVGFSGELQPGFHHFAFQAGGYAHYILSVETSRHRQVQQLISTYRQGVDCRLEYTGSSPGASGQRQGLSLFPWAPGDSLRFIGYTSSGADTIVAQPLQSTLYTFQYVATACPPTVTDYNGNVYNTVQIGNQCWMKENLKARSYRNGTAIPNVTDGATWGGLTSGARCWYNNDSATYAATYGALYNWYAVDNSGGLCPTGWHVPTDMEWQTLEMYLGMSQNQANLGGPRGTDEGGKMKEAGLAHWNFPNTGATNSSGFTALPGGARGSSGYFNNVGDYGYWWSSTAYPPAIAWNRALSFITSEVFRDIDSRYYGFSVRCLRDSSTTSASLPTVSTDAVTAITDSSGLSGGNISNDGGAAVTVRGVCWSTSQFPTLSGNHSTNGTGSGTFTSSLTGLAFNTLYYVRAYATNSVGTAYGNQVSFTTLAQALFPIYDIDGNGYDTVQIGTQIWLKQNLKTTRYRNGTTIPNITSNSTWVGLTTGARCWYNNDSATYAATYGALYNWYAVDNSSGLCPTGWHVPTDMEWQTLEMYLGMTQSQANSTGLRGTDEGGKLKEAGLAHWNSPNTGATNSSGFTALPGGYRVVDGNFYLIGSRGGWWSSTASSTTTAWLRYLYYNNSGVTRNATNGKYDGFPVRCLKD